MKLPPARGWVSGPTGSLVLLILLTSSLGPPTLHLTLSPVQGQIHTSAPCRCCLPEATLVPTASTLTPHPRLGPSLLFPPKSWVKLGLGVLCLLLDLETGTLPPPLRTISTPHPGPDSFLPISPHIDPKGLQSWCQH